MTMSTSPGGVEFEELEDSPRIKIGQQGMTAERRFRLPTYLDWKRFVKELIGEYRATGIVPIYTAPIAFPGWPNLLVNDVAVDPFNRSAEGLTPVDLGSVTQNYTGGALITANYRTAFDADGAATPDTPGIPPGTTLTYQGNDSIEIVSTPGRVWKWGTVGGNPKVDPDTFPGLVVPAGDFTLTWGRVPLPPWSAIRSLRGRLNESAFMGEAAGTVLFMGCRSRKMFQLLEDDGFWEFDYLFNVSSRKRSDGTIVGPNYFYREQASGGEHWHSIQNESGDPPYLSGDFAALFQFPVSV